jgi:MerR family mercuric resistance operon transcriptional regulator
MPASGFQIGELSRRTGCNIETIRYYERIGLLPHPRRSGRYRNYDPADAERLAFIRRARELGFTLDEVRARIADLRRMASTLAAHVRACDAGDNIACPMIGSLCARPQP